MRPYYYAARSELNPVHLTLSSRASVIPPQLHFSEEKAESQRGQAGSCLDDPNPRCLALCQASLPWPPEPLQPPLAVLFQVLLLPSLTLVPPFPPNSRDWSS